LGAPTARTERVHDWLDVMCYRHRSTLRHVVIAGDGAEGYLRAWWDAAQAATRLIAHLASATDQPTQIWWIGGNHDDWIVERVIRGAGRIHVRAGVVEIEPGVLVTHGHQWATGIGARTYRALDRLDWRGSRYLWRIVHAAGRRLEMEDPAPYRVGAEALAIERGATAVLYGHTHQPAIERSGGSTRIDLGSWIEEGHRPTYAVRLRSAEWLADANRNRWELREL
ncbi:MAG: metallophosphoesterase family protein, partial [Myxococcales bacterium]|nr:metallophosphoesterase family protein [Myxococcales bacterium]